MPFKSYKQMAYLKHNHPNVYADWVKKYGKEVEPTKKSRLAVLRRG